MFDSAATGIRGFRFKDCNKYFFIKFYIAF